MEDIEKVMKGLGCCLNGNVCNERCPYSEFYYDNSSECTGMLMEDAFELLKEQPKWIPASEKLPKKPDGYPKCELRRMYFLVSLESGCVESLGFDFDDNRWHTTGSPVIAWMKLPEPYVGKDGEQDEVQVH